MLGNADDAEDALHDAFVAAFRSHDRYNGGDPYPWLYRIATRKALNILAARKPGVGDLAVVEVAPSAEEQALQSFSRAGTGGAFARRARARTPFAGRVQIPRGRRSARNPDGHGRNAHPARKTSA